LPSQILRPNQQDYRSVMSPYSFYHFLRHPQFPQPMSYSIPTTPNNSPYTQQPCRTSLQFDPKITLPEHHKCTCQPYLVPLNCAFFVNHFYNPFPNHHAYPKPNLSTEYAFYLSNMTQIQRPEIGNKNETNQQNPFRQSPISFNSSPQMESINPNQHCTILKGTDYTPTQHEGVFSNNEQPVAKPEINTPTNNINIEFDQSRKGLVG